MNDISYFGMTREAERRVMRNHIAIVQREVQAVLWDLDIEPQDYDCETLEELYDYRRAKHNAAIFKDLISFGTRRGGMTSAIEELEKMGVDWGSHSLEKGEE